MNGRHPVHSLDAAMEGAAVAVDQVNALVVDAVQLRAHLLQEVTK